MKKLTFASLFIMLCMVMCGCNTTPDAKAGEKVFIDKEELDGSYAELSFELAEDFYSSDKSYSGVCRFGIYDSENHLIASCPFNAAALATNFHSVIFIQENNEENLNTGVTFVKDSVLSYVKTEAENKTHYILYAVYRVDDKNYVSFYCYHENELRPIGNTDIEISDGFAYKENLTFYDSELKKAIVVDIDTHSLEVE